MAQPTKTRVQHAGSVVATFSKPSAPVRPRQPYQLYREPRQSRAGVGSLLWLRRELYIVRSLAPVPNWGLRVTFAPVRDDFFYDTVPPSSRWRPV